MFAAHALRAIRLGTTTRFASTAATAGRLEKPPLRGQHRYEIQNVIIGSITLALGVGFFLNHFFWLPRKARMNEFFKNHDGDKRTKELLDGGILDLAIDDVE